MQEALGKFKREIEELINYEFDDATFTTWVRMAESRISRILRCEDQIEFSTTILADGRARLPRDWEELEFVRVVGGVTLHQSSRDALHVIDPQDENRFAVAGNYVIVGHPIDSVTGLSIEITYFKSIPALGAADTWFSEKYRWLFTAAVVGYASVHMQEDARAQMMSAEVSAGVADINNAYAVKRFSGSTIVLPTRKRRI